MVKGKKGNLGLNLLLGMVVLVVVLFFFFYFTKDSSAKMRHAGECSTLGGECRLACSPSEIKFVGNCPLSKPVCCKKKSGKTVYCDELEGGTCVTKPFDRKKYALSRVSAKCDEENEFCVIEKCESKKGKCKYSCSDDEKPVLDAYCEKETESCCIKISECEQKGGSCSLMCTDFGESGAYEAFEGMGCPEGEFCCIEKQFTQKECESQGGSCYGADLGCDPQGTGKFRYIGKCEPYRSGSEEISQVCCKQVKFTYEECVSKKGVVKKGCDADFTNIGKVLDSDTSKDKVCCVPKYPASVT